MLVKCGGRVEGTSSPSLIADRLVVPGIEAGWLSHAGRVRKQNEDAAAVVALPVDRGVFVVISDGMGGHAGGEIASRLVCDRLLQSVEALGANQSPRERYETLCSAIREADGAVRTVAADQLHLSGMGATVVAAAVTPRSVLHAYVGDSRLYLFRGGGRVYRTQDQTVVEVLRQLGQVREADMGTHPQRNQLLACLGGSSAHSRCEVAPPWLDDAAQQEAALALEPDDTLVFCSDGLSGQVSEAMIAQILSASKQSAPQMATRLVEAALAAGGADNITVGVVKIT